MQIRNIAVAVLATGVVCASVSGAGDVLQQLKVSKAEAGKEVVAALAHGSVPYYRVRDAFKAASPAVRASLVEQVLVWTKAYVSSPQFLKDYAAYREERKPQPPEAAGSVDDELKRRRAQRMAELEDTKKSIAELPAEYRKEAEQGYKAALEAMKEFDTPEFRKMEREAILAERQGDKEAYEQALEQWKEEYPADPRPLVQQRLREFLEETADVDFNAKLVNRHGRMRFANEEYESKSGDWKLAYRAGREATQKARAFAQAWLAGK